MRPPRAIDNGIFQIRTSDYVEPRDPFNGQFNYNAQNKTLIISPVDGQTDFPIDGLYEFFKNEDYTRYRIKLSATGDFENPDEVINVTAGTLTGEQEATLTAGTWHMKVVPIQSDVPSIPDEITGVSISTGADSVTEGSTITRIGTVEGTGDYNTSGTWTRQSGSATTFVITGNSIAITGATAGTSDVYRFTADDGTFAEITIEVTEADANPTIQNDSIDGDLIALNELYTQTGGPDGFWDVSTGWPIADTASMGDAYGITVWESGENAGRVRSLRLRENGLRNIELNASGAPVIVHKDTGAEISVINGDEPVITDAMGGSGSRPTLAVDLADRYKERYKLIEGKEIKASIGNLQKCEEFSIELNQIGGPMPDQMQALSSCVRWVVGGYKDDNFANPMWTGRGGYPTKYNQWYNKFEGRFHPNIHTLMPNLKSVFCARNYFDNTPFPDGLLNLPLEHLSIGHNGLIGEPADVVPVFADTILSLIIYGGTAHSTRNTGSTKNEGANIHLGFQDPISRLPEFVGYCNLLETIRIGYNNFGGDYRESWQNLSSVRVIEIGGDDFTGPFPTFFNQNNMPNLNTLVIGGSNVDPPVGGLPSDYRVNVSGKINFSRTFIGGSTPISWRTMSNPAPGETVHGFEHDPNRVVNPWFPAKVQIFSLILAGISGPFAEDENGYANISQMTNTKSFRMQGNGFTSGLFSDYPHNDRITDFRWNGNDFWGVLNTNFRKIVSTGLFAIMFADNRIGLDSQGNQLARGYETGALGAIEIDASGNVVSGMVGEKDGRLFIHLHDNYLTTDDLDAIILDVKANIESRIGTAYEYTISGSQFELLLYGQKNSQFPSDTTEINNAITYLRQFGTVQIE